MGATWQPPPLTLVNKTFSLSAGNFLLKNGQPPCGLVRGDEVYGQVSDVAELARRRFLGLVL